MHPTDATSDASRHVPSVRPASAARSKSLVVAVAGELRLELDLPGGDKIDETAAVIEGRIELTPMPFALGSAGRFVLDHMSLSFADLSIDRPLLGTHAFRMAGAHLRGAVLFAAPETRPGVYAFALRPQDVNLFAAVLDNERLHAGLERPSQDVKGTIDLNASVFEARLVTVKRAAVRGLDLRATLTTTLAGVIRPS